MKNVVTFLTENIKLISVAVFFFASLWLNQSINRQKINDLELICTKLDYQISHVNSNLDTKKVEKEVFQIYQTQMTEMKNQLSEIQRDIKTLMQKK